MSKLTASFVEKYRNWQKIVRHNNGLFGTFLQLWRYQTMLVLNLILNLTSQYMIKNVGYPLPAAGTLTTPFICGNLTLILTKTLNSNQTLTLLQPYS